MNILVLDERLKAFMRSGAAWIDRIAAFRRTLATSLVVCFAVALGGLVLDHGAWTGDQTLHGPFDRSDVVSGAYASEFGAGVPFWLRLSLDQAGRDGTRNPQLAADGRDIALPAMPYVSIHQGLDYWLGRKPRTISFGLPADVANGPDLTLTVRYVVRLHSTLYDAAVWGAVLLLTILAAHSYRSGALAYRAVSMSTATLPRMVSCVFGAAAFALCLAGGLATVACAGYFATVAYGIAAGDALPSATIFRIVPHGIPAAVEPYLPTAILLFAACGTVLAWGATLGLVRVDLIEQTEHRIGRWWGLCGLPLIFGCLLLSLSAGGWSGHLRPGDLNSASIAGLKPHGDALSYYTDAYRLALWGKWIGAWRPLAEAFRQVTALGGEYVYTRTLLVQSGLLAVALFLAARSLGRWHGVWAAIGFVGLIYILVRPFLATTLTEPLALILVLLSVVCLLDALRLRSLPHALLALAGVTAALVVRMGSMFTIPFLVIWLAFSFAEGMVRRVCVFALACGVVIAILGLNGLIASLYAESGTLTGGNFAWVACGLSVGGDWTSCNQLYAREIQSLPNQQEVVTFLLSKAWHNALSDPSAILSELAHHAIDYVSGIPAFVFDGYGALMPIRISTAVAGAMLLVLCASLLCVNYRRSSRAEILFWPLLFGTIVISAAVVFGDDGWRTLFVTHALIACFLTMGLAAPITAITADKIPTWRWQSAGSGAVAVALALAIAPASARVLLTREMGFAWKAAAAPKDESVILGGRFVAGFLVVADDFPTAPRVAALHASDFVALMRSTSLGKEFGLTAQDILTRVPFAFVWAPRLNMPDDQTVSYIAPPDLLLRPEIPAWHLHLRARTAAEKPWNFLQEATAAEPLP